MYTSVFVPYSPSAAAARHHREGKEAREQAPVLARSFSCLVPADVLEAASWEGVEGAPGREELVLAAPVASRASRLVLQR